MLVSEGCAQVSRPFWWQRQDTPAWILYYFSLTWHTRYHGSHTQQRNITRDQVDMAPGSLGKGHVPTNLHTRETALQVCSEKCRTTLIAPPPVSTKLRHFSTSSRLADWYVPLHRTRRLLVFDQPLRNPRGDLMGSLPGHIIHPSHEPIVTVHDTSESDRQIWVPHHPIVVNLSSKKAKPEMSGTRWWKLPLQSHQIVHGQPEKKIYPYGVPQVNISSYDQHQLWRLFNACTTNTSI